jgi:hypothetical protein
MPVIFDNSFHAFNGTILKRRREIIIARAQSQDKGDQRKKDHAGKNDSSHA